MDFSKFKIVTFDCYGTLIDWESGILRSVRSAFPGLKQGDAEILAAYSEIEPQIQQGVCKPYRLVLREVVKELGLRFGRTPVNPDAIAESLGGWLPFSDTNPALERLKERYKLGIISNIDDDLFAATAKLLSVQIDYVITAQQVGSYKPNTRNFEVALARMNADRNSVVHVAESLFHDIAPARQLGIANVWINRRQGKVAASRLSDVQPCLSVPDLNAFADLALAP